MVPGVFRDIDIDMRKSNALPMIVFSHGLTGTGEEHATLFAHWARLGFVVSCVLHTDGSSSRSVGPDGKPMYYQHPPSGAPGEYPPNFRPNQIEHREANLSALYNYIWYLKVMFLQAASTEPAS